MNRLTKSKMETKLWRVVPVNLTVTDGGSGTACNKLESKQNDKIWMERKWKEKKKKLTGTDPWSCWLSMVVYFPDIIISSSSTHRSLSFLLSFYNSIFWRFFFPYSNKSMFTTWISYSISSLNTIWIDLLRLVIWAQPT